VSVEALRVSIRQSGIDIVRETSLRIAAGEIVGLVGESGSGKSTLALAMLWHAGRGLRISGGEVLLRGRGLSTLAASELRTTRGREVAYVAQDPLRALNPALRIGDQLREMLRVHDSRPARSSIPQRLAEALAEVGLPADRAFLARFPHQLSGGQQQRVALAMAFACRPSLVVLDEPTTGLDVRTQAHVLATVRRLCAHSGAAALYVSHDLAVVAAIADRVAVMYSGRVVELGATADVIGRAAHPYTRRLLAAVPDGGPRARLVGIGGRAPPPDQRPPGCAFWPRCDQAEERCRAAEPDAVAVAHGHLARCWFAGRTGAAPLAEPCPRPAPVTGVTRPELEVARLRAWYGTRPVLHDVSLTIAAGSCVALVGESGSGKTTLSRCIAGMHAAFSGRVALAGVPLAQRARARPRAVRSAIQYIFQNPYSALNPRRTIEQALQQWIDVLEPEQGGRARAGRADRIAAALERVGLGADMPRRYPDELSGGQQQRVAIARALICRPSFLICDEITSALDVSVQASIMTLLERLRREEGLGMLFVAHNLLLVRAIADRVVVMRDGAVVESGTAEAVFTAPRADYTRELLRLTPSLRGVLADPASG
jgi:peptide/nickel transport system ATP-binding protein